VLPRCLERPPETPVAEAKIEPLPTSADGKKPRGANGQAGHADIGPRLRYERQRRGVSLRKLAARLDISPSALSQIELGRSRPSVRTLYAIVTELDVSLDELLSDDGPGAPAGAGAATAGTPEAPEPARQIVTRVADRRRLDLDTGAHWERLNPPGDGSVDFQESIYEPGGASCPPGMYVRHDGREYGLVISGRLKVAVGFDEYELEPGDAISFDSQTPHRLEAIGDEPARTVWFVIGRGGSDSRARWPGGGA
jgi:transcriptional regulator with XRE-family HTH domain